MNILLTFLRTTIGKVAAALVFGIIVGFMGHWLWGAPTVVKLPGTNTETRYVVNTPVITPGKEILSVVTDKTQVAQFLKEQEALKRQITMLSETLANLQRTGDGKIVYVDRPVPGTTQTVREASFKDWRLNFTAKGDDAHYTLSQRFETLTTAGKDAEGQPIAAVKMFEIGPGETRTELPIVKNTVVFARQNARWWFAPTVQAGFAGTLNAGALQPGFTAGVQWLKRGSTKAAEDSTLSLLTPVVLVQDTQREFGLLPMSLNLGRIPYQPLKDVWLSPYVGLDLGARKVGHLGFSITASF